MSLRRIIAFGLLLALALYTVECSSDEQSNITVKIVEDMPEFLRENPHADFTPFKLVEETTQPDTDVTPPIIFTFTYRIGYRVGGKIIVIMNFCLNFCVNV